MVFHAEIAVKKQICHIAMMPVLWHALRVKWPFVSYPNLSVHCFMKIKRLYTQEHDNPYHGISFSGFEKDVLAGFDSQEDDYSGREEIDFEREVFYLPSHWDKMAKSMFVDWLMLQEGVPTFTKTVPDEGTPSWLWRSEPDWEKLEQLPRTLRTKGEKDVRDVINRIVGGWTYTAWHSKIFDTAEDARAFYDELRYALINSLVFPETAQWHFVGVEWAYGIHERIVSDYAVVGDLEKANRLVSSSKAPPKNKLGIWAGVGRMDSMVPDSGDDAGTDTALSAFDWTNLSNFMMHHGQSGVKKINAQKIVLSADHPEIESFIDWKLHEEHKIASLITGSRVMHKYLKAIVAAASEEIAGKFAFDEKHNPMLARAIHSARQAFIPEHTIQQVIHLTKQGVRNINFSVFDADWDGEAYRTVHGSRVHTAVRIPHALVEAAQDELLFDCWTLRHPVSGKPHGQTSVQSIWDRLATANWYATEPTVEFDTTIQEWNTCPNSGKLHSSSPSGGYIFQDESHCFGATFNLKAFLNDPLQERGGWHVDYENGAIPDAQFQSSAFSHIVQLITLALDCSHTLAAKDNLFPDVAYQFRPIGLNFCDLSAVLMRLGLAYDSDEARSFASSVAALMTGESFAMSAQLAGILEPFAKWQDNVKPMQRVLRNFQAIVNGKHDGYDGLLVAPPALLDVEHPVVIDVIDSARDAFSRALRLGEKSGYRNGFVSLISPLSRSSMVMGGRISGVDPESVMVVYREGDDDEAHASMERDINPNVPYALRRLGYSVAQVTDIVHYVLGAHTLRDAPHINTKTLQEKGFTAEQLDGLEEVLSDCYDIRFAFNRWTLGDDFCRTVLGVSQEDLDNNGFDLLPYMGFTPQQIDAANMYCCGTLTLENAPHIRDEHRAIFDCSAPVGRNGTRRVGSSAHILMAASVGAFVSGGVGTTITLDYETTIDTIKDLYFLAWSLGMKNISLYRQGAKLCQSRFQDVLIELSGEEETPVTEMETVAVMKDMNKRDKNVVSGILSSPSAKRIPLLAGQIARHMAAQQKIKDARAELDNAFEPPLIDDVNDNTKDREILYGELLADSRKAKTDVRRQVMPQRRKGYTQKASVGGHKIYLRTGEYADGTLGEIFIDMHKEGEAFRSLLNNFAIAISIGLQYGVPLEDFVEAFIFTRFEPSGAVEGNEAITTASSVMDYIFRELAISYLERADLANVEACDLLPDTIGKGDIQSALSGKVHNDLNPETVQIIRQAVSGGYTRQNLRRVQENLLNKITANSNLALNAALEDERIRALGIQYEDVDEITIESETDSKKMQQVFYSSVKAIQDALHSAREKGYEGVACSACGHMTILKIGHFLVCDTCSYIHEDN